MDIAARLRREVLERVGLPITVGVARTKFLAKVASGVAKPDGLLVVPPDGELGFLHPLPVERLWGVGPVTVGEAARRAGSPPSARSPRLAEPALVAMLGRAAGRQLHALAHNRDPRPVRVGRRRRSIGSQRALGRRRRSRRGARRRRSSGIVDRVARRLRAARRVCRTVVLRLRFDDFSRATRSHTLPTPRSTPSRSSPPRGPCSAGALPLIGQRGLTLRRASRSTNLETTADVQLVLPFDAPPRARRGARQRARPLRHDRHHPRGAPRPRPGAGRAAAARLRLACGSTGYATRMAEERKDPVPTDDPRGAETSDQNAEESHPGAGPGSGEPGDSGPSPDAPDTSHEQEGDAGQATGNPDAAG